MPLLRCSCFPQGTKLVEKARNMARIRTPAFGNSQSTITQVDQAFPLKGIEQVGRRQQIGGLGINLPMTQKRRDYRTAFFGFLIARHAPNSRDLVRRDQ